MITRLNNPSLILLFLAIAVTTAPGIAIARSCNANSAQGRAGLNCGAATQNHPATTSTMNGHSQGPTGPVPVANQLPTPAAKPPQQVVVGRLGPSFTGYAPAPQIQVLPGQVITGYGPVPSPAVPPLPPQPPVPAQSTQQVVPPPVPQPYPVPPAPHQVVVGQQGPSFTGYAPAPQLPLAVPVGGSAAVKPKPLRKIVNEIATPIPHEITDKADSAKSNSTMIANLPGRQDIKKYPEFSDSRSGLSKGCVLSGLDRRQVVSPDGGATYHGTLPHLRTVSAVITDIPSWHPHESGCIVSINKK